MHASLGPFVQSVLVTVGALMPLVNPLGSAPLFLSMTADLPTQARHQLARRVAWNALVLLTASMLVGSHVLAFFGISLPIVRVGGGLLVSASGWRMLHADEGAPGQRVSVKDAWEREVSRRAFYPLTFPLTVGPGSITVAITAGARVSSNLVTALGDLAMVLVGVAIVSAAVFLCYRYASKLIAALGETGTTVFLRLSAFILLCIGVSITWSGVSALLQPLVRR